MSADNYTLYHGDCLDIMPGLAAGSADLIFTSPPYYNAREYSRFCSYEEYISFLRAVLGLCYMRLNRDGIFVLNVSPVIVARNGRQEESVRLPIPFDACGIAQSVGFKFIDDIIWLKPDGASNRAIKFSHHRRPVAYKPFTVTEYLLVFRRNDAPLIDKAIRKHPKEIIDQALIPDGYERTNVWPIPPETQRLHPAQFPLELGDKVVRYYSYPGDVVMDCFFGSCTTGVAAIRNGRRFIGIEKDAGYFEIGKKRMEAEARGYGLPSGRL